jgi:hypothetical protein
MTINLRQYNLKPNSNYNVSITMKKGDRIIDNLRSVYVSTPKYITTNIENSSTTSTIVFDRSYNRHTKKEPSVKITLPTPGKSPTTEIIKWEIDFVYTNFPTSSKQKIYQGAAGHAVERLHADVPKTLTFSFTQKRTFKGSATLASNHPLLRSLNRPVVVNISDDTYDTVILSPKEIDPSVTWKTRPLAVNKNGGFWSSETLEKLYRNSKGKGGIDTKSGDDAATAWLNISVDHPEVLPTAGSTVNLPGIYVDVQGLTQTLKTSLNNQDLISQLYWDDIGEPDAIRDVVYFFFRDDTGDNATTLNDIGQWVYLDESFISASPVPPSNRVTAVNDSSPAAGSATYTSNAHSLSAGDVVTISGASVAGYNGTFIVTAETTNTFTVANATTGAATFTSGSAQAYISKKYKSATGNKLIKTVPVLEQKYLDLSEPEISLSKIVYQTIDQYESLLTPTQVRVAFTIARYTRNSNTGDWSGVWLKTYTSGDYKGYPVLSTPEILSGSS